MKAAGKRLRRAQILRRAKDFQRVTSRGTRAIAPNFIIRIARECGAQARLGITASRKVGNAVARNRVKRMVREWFRHNQKALWPGADVVVIARKGAPQLHARAAARMLNEAMKRGANRK